MASDQHSIPSSLLLVLSHNFTDPGIFLACVHRQSCSNLQFSHIDDSTNTVSTLHGLKCRVHLTQSLAVGDEFVNL